MPRTRAKKADARGPKSEDARASKSATVPRSGRRAKKASEPTRAVLRSEWCAWIAENIVGGVADDRLIADLVASDVPRALAKRAVADIKSSPALHAVAAALAAKRAGDLRARLLRELAKASPSAEVERRKKPTAAEFFDRYWRGNRPVVFTDAMKGWKRWSPRVMKRLVGDVEIEVTEGRDADPRYDENFRTHARKTTVAAFVDRVLAAPRTNDFYMVAQGRAMDRPEMGRLLDRIVLDEDLFDPRRLRGGTSLWLGPAGTVTPLHHDATNIFFGQIYGRKQFLIASPHETEILATARGFYADVDPEAPDLDLYPWWKEVALQRVVLEPGEVLFLPVGWWHHVRSLDVSISLSLLNFRRPNAFNWYRPGFRD